jgi:excisionase family DNA binding protein
MREREMLTTTEAARILRLKPSTLAAKIKRGEVRAVKIGRNWLIARETLDALLEPSTTAPQG